MNAVPFDTLKLARDLESAGLAGPAAAGAAAALADALAGADLATKSDLAQTESRILQVTRSEMAQLDAKIAAVAMSLEILRRDMTIKLGGMMFVAVGVILTAMRFMPHP